MSMQQVSENKAKKTVYLDIMYGGRYIGQVPYQYCPLFALNYDDIMEHVFQKRPSLRGKNIKIIPSDNRVI